MHYINYLIALTVTVIESYNAHTAQVGCDPVSTDLNYWKERGVQSVGEFVEFENARSCFSDDYKEHNGIRPRWMQLETLSHYREAYESLQRSIDWQRAEEAELARQRVIERNRLALIRRKAMTRREFTIGEILAVH